MSQAVNDFLDHVREAWERQRINSGAALLDAAMRKRNGSQIHIGRCADCGVETHHDVWVALDESGIQREHDRCQKCGKHSVR